VPATSVGRSDIMLVGIDVSSSSTQLKKYRDLPILRATLL
jgi:hypothetical protein